MASKQGTRYSDNTPSAPKAFGSGDPNNPVVLAQVLKLLKMDGVHLVGANNAVNASTNSPPRPVVAGAYQVGDMPATSATFAANSQSPGANSTTFTYPVPTTASQPLPSPQYIFTKIIEFNPQGEASKITENTAGGAGVQKFIEIAFQPTHGNTVDPRYAGTSMAAAAIQIEGITGQVRIYRP